MPRAVLLSAARVKAAFTRLMLLTAVLLLGACGDDEGADPDEDAAVDAGTDTDAAVDLDTDAAVDPDAAGLDADVDEGLRVVRARFDLDADPSTPEGFFELPYPADIRLDANGTINLDGLPNPNDLALLSGLKQAADELRGYPTVAGGWFRFTGALAPRGLDEVIEASLEAPILLIDIDPDSPERGRLLPVVAQTLPRDPFTPEHVLAVTGSAGVVLWPERTYAFVVMAHASDAEGEALEAPEALAALARGETPQGALGAAAAASYGPLWETLDTLGVDRARVAAATVFTTGDVVRGLHGLTEWARARYAPRVEGLAVDPDDGAAHARFCELHGTLTLPQFQVGAPPFNTDGLFVFDAEGHPIEQRQTTIPVTLNLPRQAMPAEGYPLVLYFHGSGGDSVELVDLGPKPSAEEDYAVGLGPAHVLAGRGFASAGSAHPVNPERVPGAEATAYLNLNNLKAFRDTFRQGVIEQRLYLDALLALEVEPAVVAACDGLSLPAGATAYRLDPEPVMAMGFSMGGMYANMVSAVEPRLKAVVPTGAGGYWSHFILETKLLGDAESLLKLVFGTSAPLSRMHPVLYALQTAWEPADPMLYTPRLARRPLPGHPVRPIYEPVGLDDRYFPPAIFDAMAVAYGHQQAGDEVWPSMQEALARFGLAGLISYPARDNLRAADDTPYTGVVVQYEGDGRGDPHVIFTQLDAVKHQYACFFASFRAEGSAAVPAPADAEDAPCL